MLIHLHVSEALQQVLGESHQKQMLSFENKKVEEIHQFHVDCLGKPTNITFFKQRLQAMFRHYNKERKGVYPFIYGKDYKPDMPEENIEYINKAH